MSDVLVDLETFGTGPEAVIAAIGAVRFNTIDQNKIEEQFYLPIDVQSCIDIGMKVDGATIMWWLQQSEAAREALTKPRLSYPIKLALEAFQRWYGDAKHIWSRGSDFDTVVLKSAFRLCGMKEPWGYKDARCVRTLEQMADLEKETSIGVEHYALHDAISHALQVQKATRILKLRRNAEVREKEREEAAKVREVALVDAVVTEP